MTTLLSILLPILMLYSWVRLAGRGSHRFEGEPIGKMPLPLLARLYMHGLLVVTTLVIAVLLAVFDVMPWTWVLAPLVSGGLLIAVPLQYTLSERGIRRTFGTFRRWTEFAGVERAPGGARLKPLPSTRPARIWLSGSRGDDEFLQLMRTLIRNAYKGKTDVPVFPGNRPSSPDTGRASTSYGPSIAAFQRNKTP